MVGSNKSVVANRMALRMANLSAADMLKAELASETGAQDGGAETVDPEVVEEKEAEEAGRAEAEKNSAAAAKLKAELMGSDETIDESPRGKKRPASSVVEDEGSEAVLDPEAGEDDSEDASVNAFLEDSLTAPKPAMVAGLNIEQPPPLKMLGNNVVEQDDGVK